MWFICPSSRRLTLRNEGRMTPSSRKPAPPDEFRSVPTVRTAGPIRRRRPLIGGAPSTRSAEVSRPTRGRRRTLQNRSGARDQRPPDRGRRAPNRFRRALLHPGLVLSGRRCSRPRRRTGGQWDSPGAVGRTPFTSRWSVVRFQSRNRARGDSSARRPGDRSRTITIAVVLA